MNSRLSDSGNADSGIYLDRIIEESEEWDVADVEGDGGSPIALSREDQRNDPRKSAPKSNHAARSALQRTEIKKGEAKVETSASARGVDLERDPKGSRGLIIHNLNTQEEVLNLFYGEDEHKIVKVLRHGKVTGTGKSTWSVHFSSHDEAKAALERQPADLKKRTFKVPGQPPKPNIKWFDEDRDQAFRNGSGAGASNNGTRVTKENTKSTTYKPVTEWGPPANVPSKGHPNNNKAATPPMTTKELSARMKARMALIDLGEEDEGGVNLSMS